MPFELLDRPGDYIDGRFCVPAAADGELRIASPADLRDVTAVHPYSNAAVHAAVDAARRAFPSWRRVAQSERAQWLRRYQAQLRAHKPELSQLLVREVGKPAWEAATEVDAMITKVDVMLDEGASYTADRTLDDLPGEIRYKPHGVVAVIGPFNFPGHLPNGQIIPALLLGNTVVHKPSERTPSLATWMARCFHEAGLPAGVFNVVQGVGSAGATLAEHPEVDGVMFTGSVAVGRRILASQAQRLDRLIALELGGKNTAVVLDDCDLERAARAIAFAAFVTAGQRCTATSRVVVAAGVADALLDRLSQLARTLQVGYPLHAEIFMGPLISDAAQDRLLAAQASARTAGFSAVVEGGPASIAGYQGHYVRPAIHVAPGPKAAAPGYRDEELFGPDLAVYVVPDADAAIEIANDTRFGLAASVFTCSRPAFEHVADGLRVGVLQWNRSTAGASGRLPFGGIKDSGNHRPAGIMAGTSCTYAQAVQLPGPADEALPSWPGLRP
ncbi:MAG TPA: aldehyde dehydrogenase family protein [Polyangiales bacterium]